jgi:hypothetical protein
MSIPVDKLFIIKRAKEMIPRFAEIISE